jgi:hypothetical protein
MRCERLSKLLVIALVLFLSAAIPVSAGFLAWQDTLQPTRTWHRPTANQQEVRKGDPTPYSVSSIYVDRSGIYQIDSDVPETGEPFPGYVFLYAGAFDPAHPLQNLIAGNEAGPDGTSLTHIASVLTAGAIYHVVTTSDDPAVSHFLDEVFAIEGRIFASGCTGSQSSNANSLGLLGGRFCVTVTWKDAAGNTHVASPVQFRSDASAGFWFYNPNTWELQVKLIDACSINKRYWLMASGATTLDYQITIEDLSSQSSAVLRSYQSKQGNTKATLDTQAFDGCPAGAAATRRK